MEIKVLGSAAAEGWPALFCECEHCEKAKLNGGKDLRSRTSYLLNGKLLLDIVFIDSTMGLLYSDRRNGHMGTEIVVEFRDKLKALGCLKPDSQVFANHFSHNGGGSHSELCSFFEPHEISVCYDGLSCCSLK
jgi:phosphoribosyl 1,2-cyclic phosphate phosphodiesterase